MRIAGGNDEQRRDGEVEPGDPGGDAHRHDGRWSGLEAHHRDGVAASNPSTKVDGVRPPDHMVGLRRHTGRRDEQKSPNGVVARSIQTTLFFCCSMMFPSTGLMRSQRFKLRIPLVHKTVAHVRISLGGIG